MRKIGLFNIGKLGLVKSAGTGKTDINKVIEKWIPKHMVFWYDMSKPVDVYIPGVTYANQFINDGGKLKYDTTINKCTITHTPTTTNRNFWQITCASSSTIDSYKIRVTGLPKGFTIQSGFYSNKITSDGEYDIASYTNTATSTRYVGFYLAGDNVSDVDCNIVVEEIPTRQSVPTNEILKANPYLQDFSGNNRPLKLNNFLFAAMSGVGGYETNFSEEVYPNALVTDGVDDYGVVENLQQGVKVLFMTAIPLGLYKTWYAQDSFSIYGQPGITAYNFRNTGGVTYLDGILNEAEVSNNLLNKKKTVTIVNPTDGGNNSIIFFNSYGSSYMSMAFYNSIGFDSVPTQQTDGFTEQDLIDYYIPKAIVTITVVDVSGSPIQDATVTVGGVQYKTLSDGTVKVRGIANSTMSLSVKKDGYMPFSDNSWKFADSRITLEVLRNTVITENGYSILLENDGLILTE